MQIRCPDCQFERDIDLTRIPASATVATCPRCGRRFHFRKQFAEIPRDPGEEHGAGQSSPDSPSASSSAGRDAAPAAENERADAAEHRGNIPPSGTTPDQPSDAYDALGKDSADPGSHMAERHASRPETPGVPWEHPESFGFFGSFYHTLLRVLFRAPDFFRGMGHGAPVGRAVVFFVLMRFLEAVAIRFWSQDLLRQVSETSPNPQAIELANQLMHDMSTPMFLLATPFTAVFQLFFLAALYRLMIRLAQPDKADFSVVVRVIAYSAAPCVFSIVPFVGSAVASVWCVAVSFAGCKYALGLSWGKTALALAPLFILGVAVLVQMSLLMRSML